MTQPNHDLDPLIKCIDELTDSVNKLIAILIIQIKCVDRLIRKVE